jgi:outer membrane immunogenic protein
MKRLSFLFSLSCFVFLPSAAVMAADAQMASGADWSGPYLGLHGGYSWGSSEATYTDDGLRSIVSSIEMEPEGFYGGVQAGYNHQTASNWVLGIEADFGLASISDEVTDELGNLYDGSTADSIQAETEWAGTLRGRVGYAADSLLIFVTGGLAFADSKVTSVDCKTPSNINCVTISDDKMLTGLAVGGGAEFMVTDNVSAKVEYLYTDYSAAEYFDGDLWSSESESSSHNIRVGVNYHF